MQIKIIIILASIVLLLVAYIFVSNKIEKQKQEIKELSELNKNLELELYQKNIEIESVSKQCQTIEKIETEKEKDYTKNAKVITKIKKVIQNEGKEPEKIIIQNFDDWILWSRVNELFGVSDTQNN